MTEMVNKSVLIEIAADVQGYEFLCHNDVLYSQNPELARYALSQYSALIESIVELLTVVCVRASAEDWNLISDELHRNISEEEGSESDGVPHRIIAAEHFQKAGIVWPAQTQTIEEYRQGIGSSDPRTFRYDPATRSAMAMMCKMAQHLTPSSAVGMAFALEVTARPELRLVAKLLNLAISDTDQDPLPEWIISGNAPPKVAPDPLSLLGFFSHHIFEWEKGHEERLADAITSTEGIDEVEFRAGFDMLCDLMNVWWVALSIRK